MLAVYPVSTFLEGAGKEQLITLMNAELQLGFIK